MMRIYIFILLVLSTYGASAQATSCTQTVRLAQSIYEQGRLHELEGVIIKALDNNTLNCGQAEKVSLLKLLTLTYIYLEEPEKADVRMLELLQTDHYFEINPVVDPAEFVALYRTFRTKEIYRIGATLGANGSRPNVSSTVTAVELAEGSKYKYGVSLQFGASLEVPIRLHLRHSGKDYERLTLHAELLYYQRKFQSTLLVDRGSNTEGKPLINEFRGIETQNLISLPLLVQYQLDENSTSKKSKYNPYLGMGLAVDYLLNAKLQGERLITDYTSVQETSFDFNAIREKINLSLLLAAGVKFRVSGGYIIAEARYGYGLTQVNSNETAFKTEQAAWEQRYADSIFKVSSLSISGAYIVNMFNPKKRSLRK
ncbi:MAG: PorT family protein [Cytophagales bacterium]|nr:PorT family protein [Cytophagales bacterium]